MIRYLISAVLELCAMIIAYITNPIVVVFADEYGNLPYCLRFWQTYDNCLDVSWVVDEGCVPEFLRYDFHKHYIYHYEDKLDPTNIKPGYVEILDPNFTFKEKLQRYGCRLYWCYRNCNYGFSYEVNGVTYDGSDNKVLRDIDEKNNRQWLSYIAIPTLTHKWEKFLYLLTYAPWSWFYHKAYCKRFSLRIYLGWKLKSCTQPGTQRAMLALHVNPFRSVEK